MSNRAPTGCLRYSCLSPCPGPRPRGRPCRPFPRRGALRAAHGQAAKCHLSTTAVPIPRESALVDSCAGKARRPETPAAQPAAHRPPPAGGGPLHITMSRPRERFHAAARPRARPPRSPNSSRRLPPRPRLRGAAFARTALRGAALRPCNSLCLPRGPYLICMHRTQEEQQNSGYTQPSSQGTGARAKPWHEGRAPEGAPPLQPPAARRPPLSHQASHAAQPSRPLCRRHTSTPRARPSGGCSQWRTSRTTRLPVVAARHARHHTSTPRCSPSGSLPRW